MPRKWTGKWFKKNSGVKPARHGKGRGKSRGLRTQASVAATPPRVTFQRAQQPVATTAQPDRRRRRRPRKQTGGQK